jgi:hypothetical protein
MTDVATHYLEELRRQFRGHKRLAEGAISQLKDEELFIRPDPEANSVAVLMKHMAGKHAIPLHRFSNDRRRKARPPS